MSYIKLDRKILDWEWFSEPTTAHLWVYLLLKANYQKKSWQGITIDEGCLVTSEARLSSETGLSRQQIRTALKKLQLTKEITKVSTREYTLIKVEKWALYQVGNQDDNQPTTSRATNGATSRATITKEVKNIRSKEEEINKEDCSPEFAEAVSAFEEMRKRIRKPLTDRAKQMILKKLSELAIDEETQIAILNQSTMNSWQGVFPLDTSRTTKKGMVNVLDL